jgi:hypothetical protein
MNIEVNIDDLDNDAYFRGIEAGKQMERERNKDILQELEVLSEIIIKHEDRIDELEMIVKRWTEHQSFPPKIVITPATNGPDMRKVFPWTGIYN